MIVFQMSICGQLGLGATEAETHTTGIWDISVSFVLYGASLVSGLLFLLASKLLSVPKIGLLSFFPISFSSPILQICKDIQCCILQVIQPVLVQIL